MQGQRQTITLRMREYLQDAGQRCPKCKSWDVRPGGDFEEGEDGLVRRKVFCYECERSWYEVYELKKWED